MWAGLSNEHAPSFLEALVGNILLPCLGDQAGSPSWDSWATVIEEREGSEGAPVCSLLTFFCYAMLAAGPRSTDQGPLSASVGELLGPVLVHLGYREPWAEVARVLLAMGVAVLSVLLVRDPVAFSSGEGWLLEALKDFPFAGEAALFFLCLLALEEKGEKATALNKDETTMTFFSSSSTSCQGQP